MTNDLRIELRARNAALWHAIFDTHGSVASFCRACGLGDQATVGGYLNLTRSPYSRKTGELLGIPRLICDFTGIGADELFPRDLYLAVVSPKIAVEVPHVRMVQLAAASRIPALGSIEADLSAKETRAGIDAVLATLNPRERNIIRMRFGFKDGEEYSRAAIADEYGVSQTRIAQIEAKDLRKLRHPSRSHKLLRLTLAQ